MNAVSKPSVDVKASTPSQGASGASASDATVARGPLAAAPVLQEGTLTGRPDLITRAVLPFLELRPRAHVLQPFAGDGRVVGELLKFNPALNVVAMEHDEKLHAELSKKCPVTTRAEFLWASLGSDARFDLVICKASVDAIETAKHALGFIHDDGVVAVFARIGALGRRDHKSFLRQFCPDVYVPTLRGTQAYVAGDPREHAWFVWRGPGPRRSGVVTVL